MINTVVLAIGKWRNERNKSNRSINRKLEVALEVAMQF